MPLVAGWVGDSATAVEARRTLEAAVSLWDAGGGREGHDDLVRHRRSQEALLETPPSVPEAFAPDLEAARRVIAAALGSGREWLTEPRPSRSWPPTGSRSRRRASPRPWRTRWWRRGRSVPWRNGLDLVPEGEREEVRQIYREKSFRGSDLERAVGVITASRERWIDTMMAEEYGQPKVLRAPWKAALSTFAAFIVCGAVPLASRSRSMPEAARACRRPVTALVFFGIGSLKSRWSPTSWWRSGLETLAVGLAAPPSRSAPATGSKFLRELGGSGGLGPCTALHSLAARSVGPAVVRVLATAVRCPPYRCRAGVIAEYPKANAVDFIVMGQRGLGEIGGLLLGSVSHKVRQLAPCARRH